MMVMIDGTVIAHLGQVGLAKGQASRRRRVARYVGHLQGRRSGRRGRRVRRGPTVVRVGRRRVVAVQLDGMRRSGCAILHDCNKEQLHFITLSGAYSSLARRSSCRARKLIFNTQSGQNEISRVEENTRARANNSRIYSALLSQNIFILDSNFDNVTSVSYLTSNYLDHNQAGYKPVIKFFFLS